MHELLRLFGDPDRNGLQQSTDTRQSWCIMLLVNSTALTNNGPYLNSPLFGFFVHRSVHSLLSTWVGKEPSVGSFNNADVIVGTEDNF